MPSVLVNWEGRLADPARRADLTQRLAQLGRLSHGLFTPPQPLTFIGPKIEGRILALPGLILPPDEAKAAPDFLEYSELAVSGVEFRLFDARDLYPGNDRISFVFAEFPGRPGVIVQLEPKERCQQYLDERIRAADWLVCYPEIHLRYYAEEWIDRLLGFVKRYYAPDLAYWRHDPLPSWPAWSSLDPADALQMERKWDEVLGGFLAEAGRWMGVGQDLRARLDHMNRGGTMPLSWIFSPYFPLTAKVGLDAALERALPGRPERRALSAAAQIAVYRARKGFDLFYLSFRFRGLTIAVSSQLKDDRLLVIRAGLAPDEAIRVIAEAEARPVAKPQPQPQPQPRRR